MRNMEERGPTWKLEGRDGDKTQGQWGAERKQHFSRRARDEFSYLLLLSQRKCSGIDFHYNEYDSYNRDVTAICEIGKSLLRKTYIGVNVRGYFDDEGSAVESQGLGMNIDTEKRNKGTKETKMKELKKKCHSTSIHPALPL